MISLLQAMKPLRDSTRDARIKRKRQKKPVKIMNLKNTDRNALLRQSLIQRLLLLRLKRLNLPSPLKGSRKRLTSNLNGRRKLVKKRNGSRS